MVRTWCVLFILTYQFTSHHSGVQIIYIPASKNGQDPSVFSRLSSKCLCSTTACNFGTYELQNLIQSWCVLCILTCACAPCHTERTWCFLQFFNWKCASCHSGVQFVTYELRRVGILTCKCVSCHRAILSFLL